MNKKYILILAAVFIVIVSGIYISSDNQSGGDSEDTTTKLYEKNWWGAAETQKFTAYGWIEDGVEFVQRKGAALSWDTDGESSVIALNQVGLRPGKHRSTFPLLIDNPYFSDYWYQIELYKDGEWTVLANKNGIISTFLNEEMESITWESQPWLKSKLTGYWTISGAYQANEVFDCASGSDLDINYIVALDAFIEDRNSVQKLVTWPNSFTINGDSWAGSFIRISLCSDFYYKDGSWGENHHCYNDDDFIVWVSDDVPLHSGKGDIALGTSEHGGSVYEEGETVTFSVSTGYSGDTENPWKFEIFGPDNEIITGRNIIIRDQNGVIVLNTGSSTPAILKLKNNLDYAPFTWEIAEGTVLPGDANGGHQWNFILTNTITKDSDVWLFVVREGMAECGPVNVKGTKSVAGQQVTVTVTAEGNTECGAGDVDYFKIRLYAGHTLYKEEKWDAVLSTTNLWKATKTFTFPYDNNLLEIEAKAFDSGGLPSLDTYGDVVHIGGDKYALKIIVTFDGDPVQGAKVKVNDEDLPKTNSYGETSISLPRDQWYDIDVTYRDSTGHKRIKLTVNGQTETINMGMSQEILLTIAIIAVIMIMCGLIAFLIPYIHIAYRIIIIIIGIIVSIFVYLIMNGFL